MAKGISEAAMYISEPGELVINSQPDEPSDGDAVQTANAACQQPSKIEALQAASMAEQAFSLSHVIKIDSSKRHWWHGHL